VLLQLLQLLPLTLLLVCPAGTEVTPCLSQSNVRERLPTTTALIRVAWSMCACSCSCSLDQQCQLHVV
jgi:hypothetical protein